MAKLDVITIGSALRDVSFYSDEFHVVRNPLNNPTVRNVMGGEFGGKLRSEEVYFYFGGGASNAAINFSGLGLTTGIITTLGSDFDGDAIETHFSEHHINTSLIQRTTKHRTGFSFLTVDKETREHVAHIYYGATRDLRISSAILKKNPVQWYYVTSLNTSTAQWRKSLNAVFSQPKTRVAWNPGGTQLKEGFPKLSRFLASTALLILNADEARELILSHPKHAKRTRLGSIEAMARLIRQWGPKRVLVTNGKKGACIATPDGVVHGIVPKDRPKDTTGAGDCFGSSLLAGIIKYNGNTEKAMKLAVYCANQLVKQIGAQQGLLTWKQLPKRLK